MTLGIVGSRTFRDYNLLWSHIRKNLKVQDIGLIVSGGAQGADKLGERFAYEHNIPTKIFLPDWEKYGKRAGFVRNAEIVALADEVIAFWDGSSRGTKHTIQLCKLNDIPVKIIIFSTQ